MKFVLRVLVLALCVTAIGLYLHTGCAHPSTPTTPQTRATAPATTQTSDVDNAEIGDAIKSGSEYLASHFQNGVVVSDPVARHAAAPLSPEADALCVYALLEVGRANGNPLFAAGGPFMSKNLDALCALPRTDKNGVFFCAQRCMALALANRPQDRATISGDVIALIGSCIDGAYGDDLLPQAMREAKMKGIEVPAQVAWGKAGWNNIASSAGLLGIQSAVDIGAEIPETYLDACYKHWTQAQLPNGMWAIDPDGKRGDFATTCAGINSLLACRQLIQRFYLRREVKPSLAPAVSSGLAWLEAGNHAAPLLSADNACALEQVGLQTGYKYFGSHAWYRELAAQIVQSQQADGSWCRDYNAQVQTAFYLSVLSRGTSPILINKLRFAGNWNNHPGDAASLAEYAGNQLHSIFNWQVVDLNHDWKDWTDSRVLYIASNAPPKFTAADYAKIRAFVNAGGTLFTQADNNSKSFNDYITTEFQQQVFPNNPLRDIPPNDALFAAYPMKENVPLQGIWDGQRLLWIHCPTDIAEYWQERAMKSHAKELQTGIDICIYAANGRWDNPLEEVPNIHSVR